MDLRLTPEQEAFRREVRTWLRDHLPPGWGTPDYDAPQTGAEQMAFARAWQRKLYDGGWAGLTWPRAYGGREAGIVEQLLYNEEYARAHAPDIINLKVGLSLVGPTLMACGTDAQKAAHLENILKGDEIWCQGFSEPNAGSDLASLKTRGEIHGDEIVVTGQKIWTSFAQYADYCILIVRTNTEAPKHKGLTFLLLDMSLPGITIRPLVEITGEAWFNEVFLDEVRVPMSAVVGEVDHGWQVVMTTLGHERAGTTPYVRLQAWQERVQALARTHDVGGRPAARDPVLRQRIAQTAVECAALRFTVYRNVTEILRTGQPGSYGSILKLFWSEMEQRMTETGFAIAGPAGLLEHGDPRALDGGFWNHEVQWSLSATIYAGTSEVQRNIIAQRVLGLPRG